MGKLIKKFRKGDLAGTQERIFQAVTVSQKKRQKAASEVRDGWMDGGESEEVKVAG